jgi:hypothetical protein
VNPTPPRPPFPPRVVRATRRFSFALLVGVALTLLPLPWAFGGLPFAVGAIVLGVVTMVLMRRVASPGLWTLVSIGTLVASSLALNFAASIVLYDEVVALQDCMGNAITIAARDRCSAEFEAAATARLHELGTSLSHLLGGQQ